MPRGVRVEPEGGREVSIRLDRVKDGDAVRFMERTVFGSFTVEANTLGVLLPGPRSDGYVGVGVKDHNGVARRVSVSRFALRKAGAGRVSVGTIVLHRVARSTGATITVERTGEGSWIECEPGWMTSCLNHGQNMQHQTNVLAKQFAAAPEEWCSECAKIASGEEPRITVGKVF